HPTRPRQREVDVALLDLVERRLEVEPALRNLDRDVEDVAGPPEVRRERVHIEHLAAPEDQRALDHVLELADVAGPPVALEDHAQELHLERGGDLRDLVEEERAAVGGREEADGARDRARERPLDVTEELRLHQGLWDRAAVDRDERPVPAGALRVDGAGDELLAGAALARDEDGAQAVG